MPIAKHYFNSSSLLTTSRMSLSNNSLNESTAITTRETINGNSTSPLNQVTDNGFQLVPVNVAIHRSPVLRSQVHASNASHRIHRYAVVSNQNDELIGLISSIPAPIQNAVTTVRLCISSKFNSSGHVEQYQAYMSGAIKEYIDTVICMQFEQVRRVEAVVMASDFTHQWILERIGFYREGVLRDYIMDPNNTDSFQDAIILSYICK